MRQVDTHRVQTANGWGVWTLAPTSQELVTAAPELSGLEEPQAPGLSPEAQLGWVSRALHCSETELHPGPGPTSQPSSSEPSTQ